MLKFRFLGFPITVEPFFWLAAALISSSGLNVRTGPELTLLLLRMAVVFISILGHELGHAFAIRKFGAQSSIILHGFGGYCISRRYNTRGQNILISAAGPAAGFLLAGIFFVVATQLPATSRPALMLYSAASFGFLVNAFWSAFNLLPVMPMDGGHIFRDIMGPRRLRTVYLVGGVVAVICTGLALMYGQYIIAILLGYLAFQNFRGHPVPGGVETAPRR